MRTLTRVLIASIFCIGMSGVAQAQTPSSKIMDTYIDWTNSGTGVSGHLKVFLTDTIGIAGVTVRYGTTGDTTANYFNGTYTIPGSFSSSGCTTDNNNVLTIPIGHFTQSITGHLKITVLLASGEQNVMDTVK